MPTRKFAAWTHTHTHTLSLSLSLSIYLYMCVCVYNYEKTQGLQTLILFIVELFANVKLFGLFT